MTEVQPATNTRKPFLVQLSAFLKAAAVFTPGIVFVALGAAALIGLDQGQDLIIVSRQEGMVGIFMVLALFTWVLITWYTARIISYNREDLYELSEWPMYHFPRILGFAAMAVFVLAIVKLDASPKSIKWLPWTILGFQIAQYAILHTWLKKAHDRLEKDNTREARLVMRIRIPVLVSTIVLSIALMVLWSHSNWWIVQVVLLMLIQACFLYLVVYKKYFNELMPAGILSAFIKSPASTASGSENNPRLPRLYQYANWVFAGKVDPKKERAIFVFFHLLCLVAFVIYLFGVCGIRYARFITPLPLVLLAFGILLGIGNFITLISIKKKFSLHFLLIAIAVVLGFAIETHPVRLLNRYDTSRIYDSRPSFHQYLFQYVSSPYRRQQIQDADSAHPYPAFFVLSNGGASRSGYWVAAALSQLADSTEGSHHPFAQHLFCLSGASGGSVGNGAFMAALKIKQDSLLNLSCGTLTKSWLDNDFLSFTLSRMLGPELAKPFFPGLWGDRAHALERGLEIAQQKGNAADETMSKLMAEDIAQLIPDKEARLPLFCINTTRVQDGLPGVIATVNMDSAVHGTRIDVLDLLCAGQGLRLSTSIILGARFPYVSPGGKLGHSYFVDGGYFDNSGAGVVHEMLQELMWLKNSTTNYTGLHDTAYATVKTALRKMKFYVVHLANSPYQEENLGKVHPLVNDLATPIITLAGSYGAQTDINNLRLINFLRTLQNGQDNHQYISLNLYADTTKARYPMNWVISRKAREAMNKRALQSTAIQEIIKRLRQTNGTDSLFFKLNQQH